MSDDTQTGVSFGDCATRAQAMEKFSQWLDGYCLEQVRAHASRLVAENDDADEITSQINQLLAFMATERDIARARFAAALDEFRSQESENTNG